VNYCQNIEKPDAIAALLLLTKKPDVLTRRNGVAALGRTNSATAGELLRRIALRDKHASVRREAIAWLSSVPHPDECVVTLSKTCEDPDPDVRTQSLICLVEMKHESGIELAVARLQDEDEGVRCAGLWALSVLAPDRVSEHIGRYHADDDWRARLQAIETGLVIRDARCIDVLIGLVDHGHGRVSTEAHRALRRITGQQYGKDPELWRAWFAQNSEGWAPPKKLYSLSASKEGSGTTVRYHGIEVASAGVVFAIDKSGSMTKLMAGKNEGWSRWGIALNRLRATIAELPDGVRVNVLLFNDRVTQAFDRARPLDDKVRKDVSTFLKRDSPGGNTNVEDTLRAALAMDDVDTLFLLGDGEPNRGPLVHGTRIRPYFWAQNRRRNLLVHTVAIGADKRGLKLLRRLASDNRGRLVKY